MYVDILYHNEKKKKLRKTPRSLHMYVHSYKHFN